jgi:hypothetical protein
VWWNPPNTWNGTPVFTEPTCSSAWNQQFVFEHIGVLNGKDSWRIHPRFPSSGMCLDIPGGTTQDSSIQIWACSGGWQQNFELRRVGDGSIQINPIYDEACITQYRYDGPPFDGDPYTTACSYSPHVDRAQSWLLMIY